MKELKADTYAIFLGDARDALSRWLERKNYASCFFLVDENTRRHCLPKLDFDFPVIEIKAGEVHKNINTCQEIWSALFDQKADRKSLLINLGGGVIGDMGGFCAATFKRGIDFVQMPTTLLAQVDASVGGKLGIDFQSIKNGIGIFKNPAAVFVDTLFLKTLPERELRSGFAELIKHALIADPPLWKALIKMENLSQFPIEKWINRAIEIKLEIVLSDPFEKNIRKALNFGHTIGHAVESWSWQTDRPLLHGEAIAFGMMCEARLSHLRGGLPDFQLEEILRFLKKHFGKISLPENAFEDLLAFMRQDKKNEQGAINFTLLSSIGSFVIDQFCEESLILEILKE